MILIWLISVENMREDKGLGGGGGGGCCQSFLLLFSVSRQFCKVDIGNFQRFLQHF